MHVKEPIKMMEYKRNATASNKRETVHRRKMQSKYMKKKKKTERKRICM